jgi:hypothetical protein
MRRDELQELQYITHMENLGSILERGILSHRRAQGLTHRSVAKEGVQDLRARVRVPGGRPLHEYANLYICGRNPALRLMIENAGGDEGLVVLRVSTNVLDLPAVVITDQNAVSEYRLFRPSPEGLAIVDQELVFAEYWTHPDDQISEWRHRSIKCAEVLVPDRVEPQYVVGAYVSCEEASNRVGELAPELEVSIDPHLFFRR